MNRLDSSKKLSEPLINNNNNNNNTNNNDDNRVSYYNNYDTQMTVYPQDTESLLSSQSPPKLWTLPCYKSCFKNMILYYLFITLFTIAAFLIPSGIGIMILTIGPISYILHLMKKWFTDSVETTQMMKTFFDACLWMLPFVILAQSLDKYFVRFLLHYYGFNVEECPDISGSDSDSDGMEKEFSELVNDNNKMQFHSSYFNDIYGSSSNSNSSSNSFDYSSRHAFDYYLNYSNIGNRGNDSDSDIDNSFNSSTIIDNNNNNNNTSSSLVPYCISYYLFMAYGTAAACEELVKFCAIYRLVNKSIIINPRSLIVYSCCAGAGFAMIENILYVYQSIASTAAETNLVDGIQTGIMRALIPELHCVTAMLIGCSFAEGKYLKNFNSNTNTNTNKLMIRPSSLKVLLLPILYHGTYDFILFISGGFLPEEYGLLPLITNLILQIIVLLYLYNRVQLLCINYPETKSIHTLIKNGEIKQPKVLFCCFSSC